MAITNIRPTKGPLHAFKLTDYELGVYGARSYLSKNPTPRNENELQLHKFIGYIEDMLPTAEHNYLGEVSKSISPEIRISNILTQLSATKGGAGLCVLPCFMAGDQPELVRLLDDEIKIIRSYWLVIQSDARLLARVRAIADFITDSVRSDKDIFLS